MIENVWLESIPNSNPNSVLVIDSRARASSCEEPKSTGLMELIEEDINLAS
jgi:hypothetical protein